MAERENENAECNEPYSNFSDVYFDYACTPCSKEKKNIEAVMFCVECNHLLCTECLGHHDKFDFMAGHQILDKTASDGGRGRGRPDIPTVRCTQHDGKILDMFCVTHDVPCCIVCDSVYHSKCSGKDYLPNVAEKYMRQEEWQKISTSAPKVIERLEQSKKKRMENLESISNQVSVILCTINEKRNAINQIFDAAENKIKTKLDKKVSAYSSALTEEIDQLDKMLKDIGGYKDITGNKADKFIKMKQINQKLRDGNKVIAGLSPPNKSINYFEPYSMTEMFGMIENFSFGHISGCGAVKSAMEEAEINIKAINDAEVCCISDSCLMEDGDIILSDQNNRNIKKLDLSFNLKECLALPGKPCAVCPTARSEVAVSLLNKKSIQFVSTDSPMSTLSSFRIGESCRGVAYSDGKLYLSCGGMTKYQDGPGEIRVYEKSGQFIRKVVNGVKIPKRITMSSEKYPVDIYIADEENGVLCLDASEPSGAIPSAFHCRELIAPVGICYLGQGQVAVCGYESDNVLLISNTGHLIRELWSKRNGIVKPKTLCLDHTGCKMLVGLTDYDFIKVGLLIRN